MATVQTILTAELTPFPFSGYVDVLDAETNTARQQIFAKVQDGTIAATGAGDNQQIFIRIDLPVNFGYVLVDYCLSLQAAAGNDVNWGNQLALNLFNGTTAARTLDIPMGLESPGEARINQTNLALKTYRPTCPYRGIVTGIGAETVRSQADGFNTTANDGAYTCDLAARFIQYDIAQLNNAAVNTPVLTR